MVSPRCYNELDHDTSRRSTFTDSAAARLPLKLDGSFFLEVDAKIEAEK